MSINEIQAKRDKETLKYELATQIRGMLDQAKAQFGAEDWEAEGIENEVAEMVFD